MKIFEDEFADDVALVGVDDGGAMWLALSISRLDDEYVVVRRIGDDDAVDDCGRLSEASSFRPSVTADEHSCYVGASELRDGKLAGVVARYPGGEVVWRSEVDGDVANVAVAATGERLSIAWDEITPDHTVVHTETVEGGTTTDLPVDLTVDLTGARTPSVATDGESVWLVCVDGCEERSIAVLRSTDDGWDRVATLAGTTAEAPALTVVGDVVVVAWHEELHAGMRWLRAAAIEDGEVREIDLPTPSTFDRVTSPTDQGWEFPSVVAWREGEAVRVALSGRSAQNFHVAFGDLESLGERVVQSPSGWGGCGRKSTLVRAADELYLGRRDRRRVVIGEVKREADPLDPERPDYGDEEVDPPAPQTRETGDVSFGQFHQHSAHSDGTGSVWDVLLRSKSSGIAFTALTDHDRFCGKAIGPATWRYIQVVGNHIEDDRFVVLPAVEFTGARHPGPGHKNVYFEGALPETIPEHTIEDLREMLVDHPAIVIPHHVGFTGWDIEHHDAEFQPLWEICSVHGVYEERDPDTVFAPRADALIEDHTIRAALDDGHRFGFCAGTDDHGLLYHHGATPRRDPSHTGLTGVIGADRTRASILAAMRARRCYATSGARILLDVTLDGEPMGSELSARQTATLRVEVYGTASIAGIDVVRKGRVETVEDSAFERELSFDGSDYVYVRVRQADHDMAWSSPIFVG